MGWLDGRAPGWSEVFGQRFAGQPFKSVALHYADESGASFARQGEFVATQSGVEGSLIYAVSSLLRERIAKAGSAQFHLDLLPQWTQERVEQEVLRPRGSRSLSSHLKGRLGLDGIKTGLLYEVLGKDGMADAKLLARTIKAVPVTVMAPRPMDEAISTAGGVRFEALDANSMCMALPGVFCAGEMLDWEAPTGGICSLPACLPGCMQRKACSITWAANKPKTGLPMASPLFQPGQKRYTEVTQHIWGCPLRKAASCL